MAYQRTGRVLKVTARRGMRLLASYLVVSGCAAVFSMDAQAAVDPCCSITSIDATSGVVTAREKAIGRSFQFKVTDAQLLGSLKPGQAVYANYARRLVSLDGSTPCCKIVMLESIAQATQPGGGSGSEHAVQGTARGAAASGVTSTAGNVASSASATTGQNPKTTDAKQTDNTADKAKSEIKKQLKKRLGFPAVRPQTKERDP